MSVTPRQAASTLLRREREAQREREARRLAALRELRLRLEAYLAVGERVWIIGSLAWGGFGAHSDVDLVVDGVRPDRLPDLERMTATVTGAPAEILELGDLPAAFRERIEREGVAVP